MPETKRAFCPYVGLRPFHEEDRAYFFGRERTIGSIIDNLFGARLTVFYGASGVGKSSVLMAGVVPSLGKEPRTLVVVFREWQIPDAASELKRRVVEAVQTATADCDVHPDQPLDELLAEAAQAIDGTVLLLLDQFEEFFLYLPETGDSDEFDVEFARAINRRDVDAGFLISLREDSLSKLDRFRYRIPALLSNTLRLDHLSREDATSAIEKPLVEYSRCFGPSPDGPVAIEGGLVKELIRQIGTGQLSITQLGGIHATDFDSQEGQIEAPYLQLVLERLWKEEVDAGSRKLRLETLSKLGGAKTIVSTHLDEVLKELSESKRELCARIFDRLVTPSGAKIACRLRDLANWAGDLADEVPDLTKYLDENRVLARVSATPGSSDADVQYQIFHDVLAPGIIDWRQRFLYRKEKAEAEAIAAERERAAAAQKRQREHDEVRALELAIAKEGAEKERQQREKERRLRDRERRLRKRLTVMFWGVAGLLILAVVGWVQNWKTASELETANANVKNEAREAKKAQAALKVEKLREEYRKIGQSGPEKAEVDSIIDELRSIIERLDPRSPSAYSLVGLIYADRADQQGAGYDAVAAERAIADLEKSLALKEDQPEVLVTLARVRHAGGDVKGALAAYDRAIALAPDDAQLYYNRGVLRASLDENSALSHHVTGPENEAIADYTEAIELRPDFDAAYLARADLYQQEDKHKEAVADLKEAVKYASGKTLKVAEARLKELDKKAAPPRRKIKVLIHYVKESDRDLADQVQLALEPAYDVLKKPVFVEGGRTSGDVRYFVTDDQTRLREDERAATDIAETVEKTLAEAGFDVKLKKIPLDQAYWKKGRAGLIEVWTPSLSRAAPQLITRDEIF